MSILDMVFHSSTGIDDRTGDWLFNTIGGEQTASGISVNPDTALTLPVYLACLRNISEDIGKLPFHVYRETGEHSKEKATDHWAYKLLHDAPNPNMTSMSFRQTLTHRAIGWGGGFAKIEDSKGGQVSAMNPIHPARVKIGREKDGTVFYMVRREDDPSKWDKVPQEKMFHIMGFSPDGIAGYVYSALAAGAIGLGLASETFGSRFFGGGAHAGTVIEHPAKPSQEALDLLRDSFDRARQGPAQSFKTLVLAGGMKLARALGIPPEEAQFLETRQMQVEELCRVLRMPPHKVQHLLRATYNNITEENLGYVIDTLMGWGVRWEQECKRKLFPDEPGIFCKINFDALLRGDPEKRAAVERAGFNVGKLSINDMLAYEDMNPIGPLGDIHWIQGAMVPIEEAVKPKEKPPAFGQAEGIGGVAPEEQPTRGQDEGGKEEGAEARSLERQLSAWAVVEPLFEAASLRVSAKEVKAIKRAAKRNAGDPEAFKAWADKFFTSQIDYLVEAMLPPARSLALLLAAPVTFDVEAFVTTFAARTMAHREEAIIGAFEENVIESGLSSWDSALPLRTSSDLLVALTDDIARTGESNA